MRRRSGPVAGLALCALALGCATPVEKALELDGWRKTDLAGIAVYTVADPPKAQRIVRDLDLFVRLVSRLVFRSDFVPRRAARLFLFGSSDQYRSFEPREFVRGHAVPADDALSVGMSADSGSLAVLRHELVHLLLQNDPGASYPRWFHEGLAELLGHAVIRSGIATLGPRPLDRMATLRRTDPLPLSRLLSSGSTYQPIDDASRFYTDSWAFVHYGLLSHGMGGPKRSRDLMRYVDAVSHGAPWDGALEEAFGASVDEIEQEYREHRRRLIEWPTHPQVHLDLGAEAAPVDFEPVDRLEIARQLGSYALDLERDRQAAALFDVVLAAAPADPAALVGRIRASALRGEFALADELWSRLSPAARETLAAREAAAELAGARYAAMDEGERRGAAGRILLERARDAYEGVLRESPGRQGALVGLGETFALEPEASDVARGVEVLQRATRADATNPELRLDLGRLCLRAGDLAAARLHLRFVVEAFPKTPYARRARDLLDEVASVDAAR